VKQTNKSRIGYHFTSLTLWNLIQHQGLVPYEIHHQDIVRSFQFGNVPSIVWLWTKPPSGVSLLGSILWQLQSKCDTSIVLLECKYVWNGIIKDELGNRFMSRHDGKIGDWQYHRNEQAVLYGHCIPPKDIRLIRVFDLKKMVQDHLGEALEQK
jgi:hypothetical protein